MTIDFCQSSLGGEGVGPGRVVKFRLKLLQGIGSWGVGMGLLPIITQYQGLWIGQRRADEGNLLIFKRHSLVQMFVPIVFYKI